MEARRTLPKGAGTWVSIISADRTSRHSRLWFKGLNRGAARPPGVEILSEYSSEYDDQTTCERIANRQIDAGSGVVFATAGDCSLGALTAAGIRGVWSVAVTGEDRSQLGPAHSRVCVTALRSLVESTVSWYLEGRLRRRGRQLGLVDDAVALVDIKSPTCPRRSGKGCARSCAASSAGVLKCPVTASRTRGGTHFWRARVRARSDDESCSRKFPHCEVWRSRLGCCQGGAGFLLREGQASPGLLALAAPRGRACNRGTDHPDPGSLEPPLTFERYSRLVCGCSPAVGVRAGVPSSAIPSGLEDFPEQTAHRLRR